MFFKPSLIRPILGGLSYSFMSSKVWQFVDIVLGQFSVLPLWSNYSLGHSEISQLMCVCSSGDLVPALFTHYGISLGNKGNALKSRALLLDAKDRLSIWWDYLPVQIISFKENKIVQSRTWWIYFFFTKKQLKNCKNQLLKIF